MSHNVCKITYPEPRRNRIAILVEPKKGDGERYIFSVRGNIHTGAMAFYMENASSGPNEPDLFHKEMIGIMWESKLYDTLIVCERIEPPKRQYSRNGKKIHPDKLTRRSKEWVEEVLMTLKNEGLLEVPDNMLLSSPFRYQSPDDVMKDVEIVKISEGSEGSEGNEGDPDS